MPLSVCNGLDMMLGMLHQADGLCCAALVVCLHHALCDTEQDIVSGVAYVEGSLRCAALVMPAVLVA